MSTAGKPCGVQATCESKLFELGAETAVRERRAPEHKVGIGEEITSQCRYWPPMVTDSVEVFPA